MAFRWLVRNAGSADAQWQNHDAACCRHGTRADENGSVQRRFMQLTALDATPSGRRSAAGPSRRSRTDVHEHFYNNMC